MGKKEKSLNQKMAEINSLWNNSEAYVDFMPEREMYYCSDEDHNCNCDSDEFRQLIDEIYLHGNTDWLAWELELME